MEKMMYGNYKRSIRILMVVGLILLLPVAIYEYSIGFVHLGIKTAFILVRMVFLSGFIFGVAAILWILMRSLRRVF